MTRSEIRDRANRVGLFVVTQIPCYGETRYEFRDKRELARDLEAIPPPAVVTVLGADAAGAFLAGVEWAHARHAEVCNGEAR